MKGEPEDATRHEPRDGAGRVRESGVEGSSLPQRLSWAGGGAEGKERKSDSVHEAAVPTKGQRATTPEMPARIWLRDAHQRSMCV
jgi:hypothetical protein